MTPDEQYIISGGEKGSVSIWDIYTTELVKNEMIFKIKKGLSVVDINPIYNIVAVSGFGSSYPVILYYTENY